MKRLQGLGRVVTDGREIHDVAPERPFDRRHQAELESLPVFQDVVGLEDRVSLFVRKPPELLECRVGLQHTPVAREDLHRHRSLLHQAAELLLPGPEPIFRLVLLGDFPADAVALGLGLARQSAARPRPFALAHVHMAILS